MKYISFIIISLSLFIATPAFAEDQLLDTDSSVESTEATHIATVNTHSTPPRNEHTEEFVENFNNLPPAIKLSFLINAFKESRLQ